MQEKRFWKKRSAFKEEDLDDDAFMALYVGADYLANEPALSKTRWFDYRFMGLIEATNLFIDRYRKVFREQYAKNVSRAAVEGPRPINPVPITSIREWARTGQKVAGVEEELLYDAKTLKKRNDSIRIFWRYRQFADALGMPYETFLNLTFKHALRYWSRNHLPTPNVLFSERVICAVAEEWEEQQKSRLFLASSEAYLPENFIGHPMQVAYHEWLLKQAKLRSNPMKTLADFVTDKVLMVKDQVMLYLTEAEYQSFLDYV